MTSPMSWIARQDLVTYLREPGGRVDVDHVDQVVELTNALVDGVAGLTKADPDPAHVRPIRFEVAARAYRNPNGYGERFGDFTPATLPGGRSGVYLTAAERDELLGLPATPSTTPPVWAGSVPYPAV